MWIRLFRAEWRKIIGHRWATGCMIWIFPVLAILVTVIGLLVAVFSSSFRISLGGEPALWTDVAILPWLMWALYAS